MLMLLPRATKVYNLSRRVFSEPGYWMLPFNSRIGCKGPLLEASNIALDLFRGRLYYQHTGKLPKARRVEILPLCPERIYHSKQYWRPLPAMINWV